MPLVNIVPNSPDIEDALAAKMQAVRTEVKEAICRVSGFPEDDVLVNLLRCPMRDVDPDSADFVVFIDTCPHTEFEKKSTELHLEVKAALYRAGFTRGQQRAEIWARFLPGPWCLVRGGTVIDSVGHPRTST